MVSRRWVAGCADDVLYSLECFRQFLLLGAERDAYVACAVAAEDESGGDEDPGFVEHLLREFLDVGIAVGNPSPEEHAHLRGVEGASQGAHDFLRQVPAAAVEGAVHGFVPLVGVAVCLCRCQLHGAEGAGVDVALHLQYPLYEACDGGEHAYAPSRHVVSFAQRVE